MVIELLDVRVAPAPTPTHQLLLRVMSAFDEMPTLSLTFAQAMRLWSLDRATCRCVLDTLIAQRFLREQAGQYSSRKAAS